MKQTQEQSARAKFPTDIKDHQMEILRDECMYRHLRFKKPDTTNMHFDIVTWPGHLCYTGDMGTYVFARVPDMFTFFRRDAGENDINLQYWAEKVLAEDRDGVEKFSPDIFTKCATEYAEEFCRDEELSEDDCCEFMESFNDEVLSRADDEIMAYEAIRDFDWHGHCIFKDYGEWNLKEYTFRYVWACLAIVHGIGMYDEWWCGKRNTLGMGR